jgi:hypothetical protein
MALSGASRRKQIPSSRAHSAPAAWANFNHSRYHPMASFPGQARDLAHGSQSGAV